jgi:rod shape determining protein RodA
VAEELGFIGSLFLLGLFFMLLWRTLGIAAVCKNRFTGLLLIGTVSIFLFQIVINIGMTMGIMPVTGIPLPFISYGGSSLLTSVILAALIVNSSIHRFTYKM